eukprot:141925_1
MGSCVSGGTERQLTTMINKEITDDKKKITKIKKILFLGSGGSGKSTLFKQLRMIHGAGFNDNDKEDFIKHVHTQVINEMKAALQVYIGYNMRKQQREKKSQLLSTNDDAKYDDESEEDDALLYLDDIELTKGPLTDMKSAEIVMNYEYDKKKHCLEPDIATAIITLWTEPVIKEIYTLRNITKIETSSAYFWDKMEEIRNEGYLPSNQDILLCRRKTTGLHEQQFEMKGDIMHIIDVGGQQSQRRKWIHCFEYVVAVIFIASLSCYDEILEEDLEENTMSDQIDLFDNICNNPSLESVAMILFLNKTDLFREKYCVNNIPLNKCDKFEEYSDPDWDEKRATDFIINEFERLDQTQNKKIFTHLTCGTDTKNIEKVFGDVQEIIIANSLAEA